MVNKLWGVEFIANDLGLNPEETTIEQLGTTHKVTITKDSTTISADAASKDEIPTTIAQIKKNLRKQILFMTLKSYRKELQSYLVV